ncbi:hypothetical protein [Microcystis aeruginosa]|nr:hypothetical protein [Microcystis aeruginosa]
MGCGEVGGGEVGKWGDGESGETTLCALRGGSGEVGEFQLKP